MGRAARRRAASTGGGAASRDGSGEEARRTDVSDADLDKVGRMFERGNTAGALRRLDGIIRDSPDSPKPHWHKAMILVEMKKFKSAVDCCRLALKLDKNFGPAYGELGLIMRRTGRAAEAIPYFDRAIKIAKRDADGDGLTTIYNNKGSALMDMNRLKEAIRCFDKIIAMDPNHVRAHINKGSALILMECIEEGEKCWMAAAEIDPKLTFRLVKQIRAQIMQS